MSEHVIELNGKRYDAITGAQLGTSATVPVPAKSHKGKVIDGIVRKAPPKVHALPHKPVEAHTESTPLPAPSAAQKPIAPAPKGPRHAHARSVTPRPKRSQTLMRSSVKRPQASLKPAIKPQAPAEVMAKPTSSQLARKHSVAQVDTKRMERAIHTPKHQTITRFHHKGTSVLAYNSAERVHTPLPVIAVHAAPPAVRRAPAVHVPKTPHSTRTPHGTIFEAAMHRATSHTQPHHKVNRLKKPHRRLVNTFAGVAAFLVLAGFISYLNMPALELKIASVQAGFHASIPDYRPTGYALVGGVDRIGGTVSVSFRSGAHRYTITQQASDWNSQTLLDNTLALGSEHTTIQKNGQTIYVYGNGTNAAWVNGGVRYDLTGNAALSKDDIAAIATSL